MFDWYFLESLILLARNSFIKEFLLLITFYIILFRFSCLVIPIIRGYWQRFGLIMQMQHFIGLACSLVSFWRYGRGEEGVVVDFTVTWIQIMYRISDISQLLYLILSRKSTVNLLKKFKKQLRYASFYLTLFTFYPWNQEPQL